MANTKWTQRFLELAEFIALWSKDPSTKCGAVLVNKSRRVIGFGYNGFPDRIVDRPEWYADRETKYELVIHAEVNAILNATESVHGSTLYVTGPCCPECAKFVVQAGISTIYWRDPSAGTQGDFAARWADRLQATMRILLRSGVPTYTVGANGNRVLLSESIQMPVVYSQKTVDEDTQPSLLESYK